MSKEKITNDDLFLRGRRLKALQSVRDMRSEAERAGSEDFLEGLVAAAAIIAHADGRLDLNERRKLVESFLATPALAGFSIAELAEELSDYIRAHSYDPALAQQHALASLTALNLTQLDKQAIRDVCHKVITADGLVHPVELGALHRIEEALGLGGVGQS